MIKASNNANPHGRLKASRKKRATLLTAGDLRRAIVISGVQEGKNAV